MKWICVFALASVGCGTVIEPGHRGLLFNPRRGGLQHDVLGPGYHKVGYYGRIDDFDVTYSTRHEEIHTVSSEGLQLGVKVSLIYRPIVSELYDLDVEIGPNFYDEVVGPEFRTATRGVFARHSYLGLQQQNEKIEDEIEDELRRRIAGKHIEVSSVTMEEIAAAPEIAATVQAKIVGEQEAVRKKTALENDALRQRLELQHQAERAKMLAEAEIEHKKHEAELAELAAAAELAKKRHEAEIAEEQAKLDKARSEAEAAIKITESKAEAQSLTLLAKAHAAEKRAEAVALTPLAVMMHAYDALGKLGGEDTHIYLGDWSRAPQFLFPRMPGFPQLQGAPVASAAKR